MRTAFSVFAIIHKGNDITNSPITNYKKVFEHIKVILPDDPSQVRQNYATMSKVFHILAGAMVRALPYKNKTVQKAVLGWNILLNAFSA